MNDTEEEKFEGLTTIRIYKIVSTALNEWCYVGHTTNSLNTRWSQHKSQFKYWYKNEMKKGRPYCSWFPYAINIKDLELKTFSIHLLVETQVDSIETTRKLEGHWTVKMKACNEKISGRNIEDWRQENPEYGKQYYEANKTYIKKQYAEYRKQYYQDKKNQLIEYQKQYYQDSKEDRNEYQKQHYQTNREKIREQQKQHQEKWKEKHECPCGGKYTTINKTTHEQTKKHKKYIDELNKKL